MNRQSAHLWADIRRRIASWLWSPFPATSWQASQRWHLDVAEPVNNVNTLAHIPLIDGIAGGQPIEWPIGTYSAVATGRLPHIRRETAIAVQPSSVQLVAFPPTPPVDRAALFALAESECTPDMDDDDATIMTERAKKRQEWKSAMSQLLPPVESEK